jgi:hypothetical protein
MIRNEAIHTNFTVGNKGLLFNGQNTKMAASQVA